MIEDIVDGIMENLKAYCLMDYVTDTAMEELKRSWRIIIRKAIADNQKPIQKYLDEACCGCSQEMLEETAVGRRTDTRMVGKR